MSFEQWDLFEYAWVDFVQPNEKVDFVPKMMRVRQWVKWQLIAISDRKILEQWVTINLITWEKEWNLNISYYSDKRKKTSHMRIGFKINIISDFTSSEADLIDQIIFDLSELNEDERGFLENNKDPYDTLMDQVVRKAYYWEE